MKIAILLPLAVLTSASAAFAQSIERENPEQLQTLLQCRSVTEAEARLRCYDSAVASLAQAAETGALVVVDQESIRRTRRSLFGLALPRLPFLGGDEQEAAQQIEASIRSAIPAGYGNWLITLEDGAVWQTTEADTRSRDPRPGDTITIRRGSLGAYHASWRGSRGVGAKRVR